MNIKLIVGVVAGIVIIGGAVFFGAQSAPRTPTSPEQKTDATPPSPTQTETGGTFSGTLAELAARGGNYRCSFSHESDVADSSGVVYVSGDRIRGDFTSQTHVGGSFTVQSHMIMKDGYTYAWTSLSPQGFRAKSTLQNTDSSTQTAGTYTDQNQTYDYTCATVSVDSTLFDLPDITFTDVN